MKHTPGPWSFDGPNLRKDIFCFSFYNGTEVKPKWLFDVRFYSDMGTEQDKANAKLIAAAPELLNALRLALNLLYEGYSDANVSPTVEIIESAIKKATV